MIKPLSPEEYLKENKESSLKQYIQYIETIKRSNEKEHKSQVESLKQKFEKRVGKRWLVRFDGDFAICFKLEQNPIENPDYLLVWRIETSGETESCLSSYHCSIDIDWWEHEKMKMMGVKEIREISEHSFKKLKNLFKITSEKITSFMDEDSY